MMLRFSISEVLKLNVIITSTGGGGVDNDKINVQITYLNKRQTKQPFELTRGTRVRFPHARDAGARVLSSDLQFIMIQDVLQTVFI